MGGAIKRRGEQLQQAIAALQQPGVHRRHRASRALFIRGAGDHRP
jgi:hypothetical protein